MKVKIHLCGECTAEVNGVRREERLPGRQGAALLGFLVRRRNRPVEREVIADALWPDGAPRSAAGSLRALLSKLRAALGPDCLVGRERIQLALPASAWVDVEVAGEAIHRAEAASSEKRWGEVWGAARAARAIVERGLLPGLEFPWVEEWRWELEEVLSRADRAIAECGLGIGGLELVGAQAAAERLVTSRPLDELATLTHMDVLAARGDTVGALLAFEAFRQRVRAELGVSPGPEAMARHRELLARS